MKTPVEFLKEMMTISLGEHHMSLFINEFNKAEKMETELLLHVIKCYHNNLFFVPLNENGEAEAILELILSGQIKSKLDI